MTNARKRMGGWAVVLAALPVSAASAATMSISLQQTDRNNATGTLGTSDLTQVNGVSALDWVKPLGSNLAYAEKNNATALTFSTVGGTFTPGTYTNDGYTLTWNGGAPADAGGAGGSSFQGSNVSSSTTGQGFRVQFTAPAAGNYTLVYYSAANGLSSPGNYTLVGHLDGSGTSLASAGSGTNIGSDSVDELVWTAQVAADSAGQVFDLDLTRAQAVNGAIAVTGASVTPEPASLALLGLAGLGLLARRRRT